MVQNGRHFINVLRTCTFEFRWMSLEIFVFQLLFFKQTSVCLWVCVSKHLLAWLLVASCARCQLIANGDYSIWLVFFAPQIFFTSTLICVVWHFFPFVRSFLLIRSFSIAFVIRAMVPFGAAALTTSSRTLTAFISDITFFCSLQKKR